jgi:TPR repeat protein
MAQINPKITIRSVYFGMLLLSAAVMILTVRLTVASDLNSIYAAAEPGDAEAQVILGYMYDTGEGVPQNDTEAVRWYRMAAEQGDAWAQLNLGYMYGTGEGIPKDYVQAYAWSNIAAAQGEETAKENLEIITKEMSTAGITKAQELSREYWEAYGPNRASSE